MAYSGFEHYPRLLRKLCKNRNIYFKGAFQNAHLAQIFSEIDVLVFPSIWYENCPLTILEAFASKTPVIASRIGSIPEFIRHRENGLLFDPDNINSIFEQLNLVIRNSDLLEKLKENSAAPKDIKENAKELEEEYSLLTRRINVRKKAF